MTDDKEQIAALYEAMYQAMIAKDTVALVNGDTARMIGRSRVNAAVYGGGRHTWRLQMDSQLCKIDGKWLVTYSRASMY